MIEKNTDSLRDFIISLDKAKADKLRYKVEDEMVKIFITPYRTSLSDKDLEFSQGDFNVDVIIALGVVSREELDQAIVSHGRILHDATVVSVIAGDRLSNLGSINWQDATASSLCEMLVSISEAFGNGLLDNQIATAFLTGIVAETERFKNEKTSPKVLTMSAQLVAAGANQQLVATELETPPEPDIVVHAIDPEQEAALQRAMQGETQPAAEPATPPEPPKPRTEVDVMLDHSTDTTPESSADGDQPPALDYSLHDASSQGDSSNQPVDQSADQPPAEPPKTEDDPSLIEINHPAETTDQSQAEESQFSGQPDAASESGISPIHIDEHGNIVDQPSNGQPVDQSSNQMPAESESAANMSDQPTDQPPADASAPPADQPVIDNKGSQTTMDPSQAPTLTLPPPVTDSILSIPSSETLGTTPPLAAPAPETQPSRGLLPSQPDGPAMSGAMEDAHNVPADATDILNLPPLDGRSPETTSPPPVQVAPHEATVQPPDHAAETAPAVPAPDVSGARDAVNQAINTAPYDASHPDPIQALNAVQMPPIVEQTAPPVTSAPPLPQQPVVPPIVDGSTQPPQVVSPTAPPATPPPLMPPIISRHSDHGASFAQSPAPTENSSEQPPAPV